ncbi:hypothetical protein PHAVU_002G058950 [Phaseolus vulgaris]
MSSFSSDNSSSLPRLGGVGRGVPKYFLNISSSESINYGSISGSSHASYVHKGPGGEAQRVAEESGKNVVVVTNCDWVDARIREVSSKYRTTSMLQSLTANVDILEKDVSYGIISLKICKMSNVLCSHGIISLKICKM